MHAKVAEEMANSVDPDQTAPPQSTLFALNYLPQEALFVKKCHNNSQAVPVQLVSVCSQTLTVCL